MCRGDFTESPFFLGRIVLVYCQSFFKKSHKKPDRSEEHGYSEHPELVEAEWVRYDRKRPREDSSYYYRFAHWWG